MKKFIGAFIFFALSLSALMLLISPNPKPSLIVSTIPNPTRAPNLGDDILSPDKKYIATYYNAVLQIIETKNNKVVFELKDYINPNINSDNPHSGNTSYIPKSWSPDSQKLIYEIGFYESASFDVIAKVNGKFQESHTWLNNLEPDASGSRCDFPIWAPDSKKLLFVEGDRGFCYGDLYLFDSTKGITAKYLETKLTNESIDDAKWSEDSKSVLITKNLYDATTGDLSTILSTKTELITFEK